MKVNDTWWLVTQQAWIKKYVFTFEPNSRWEVVFLSLSFSFYLEWNVRGAVGHVAWLTERSYLTTSRSIQDAEDIAPWFYPCLIQSLTAIRLFPITRFRISKLTNPFCQRSIKESPQLLCLFSLTLCYLPDLTYLGTSRTNQNCIYEEITEQMNLEECLIPLSLESVVIQSAVQRSKD